MTSASLALLDLPPARRIRFSRVPEREFDELLPAGVMDVLEIKSKGNGLMLCGSIPAEILAYAAYPKRCSSNANGLGGQTSAGFWKSVRPFKGIFCVDVSEFEPYMPSHAVRSPPAIGG